MRPSTSARSSSRTLSSIRTCRTCGGPRRTWSAAPRPPPPSFSPSCSTWRPSRSWSLCIPDRRRTSSTTCGLSSRRGSRRSVSSGCSPRAGSPCGQSLLLLSRFSSPLEHLQHWALRALILRSLTRAPGCDKQHDICHTRQMKLKPQLSMRSSHTRDRGVRAESHSLCIQWRWRASLLD